MLKTINNFKTDEPMMPIAIKLISNFGKKFDNL